MFDRWKLFFCLYLINRKKAFIPSYPVNNNLNEPVGGYTASYGVHMNANTQVNKIEDYSNKQINNVNNQNANVENTNMNANNYGYNNDNLNAGYGFNSNADANVNINANANINANNANNYGYNNANENANGGYGADAQASYGVGVSGGVNANYGYNNVNEIEQKVMSNSYVPNQAFQVGYSDNNQV